MLCDLIGEPIKQPAKAIREPTKGRVKTGTLHSTGVRPPRTRLAAIARRSSVWARLPAQVEEDIELDQKKLAAALEKVSKHNRSEAVDERKRGYNSFAVSAASPRPRLADFEGPEPEPS